MPRRTSLFDQQPIPKPGSSEYLSEDILNPGLRLTAVPNKARAVEDLNLVASEARAITARWDVSTLKWGDITSDPLDAIARPILVTQARGLSVLEKDLPFVYVKTKRETAAHEIEVYNVIKSKGIALNLKAIIADNDDDQTAIGFVQAAVDGVKARTEDLPACAAHLGKLHDEGWLHVGPNKGNYMNYEGIWFMYGFEDSKRMDDPNAYDPDLTEDEHKAVDLEA